MKKSFLSLLLLAFAVPALSNPGTTFTYQGLLQDNGLPVNGTVSLELTLHDHPTTGSLVAGPVQIVDTFADAGRVAVSVDFGAAFDTGAPRYLAVAVDLDGGTDNLVPLEGRVPIRPVPYAIYSQNAGHAVMADIATTAVNVDDADADPTNELQNLSVTGTTISISDGNSIDLNTMLRNLPAGVGIGTAAPGNGLVISGPAAIYVQPLIVTTISNSITSETFTATDFQQTFTATQSGTLNSLTFQLAASHTGFLQYALYQGDRIGGSSTLIDSRGFNNPSAGTVTRPSASEVILAGGQTYTIRLYFTDNRSFSLLGSSGNAYAGGYSTAGTNNDIAFSVQIATLPTFNANSDGISMGARVGIMRAMGSSSFYPLEVGTSTSNGNGAHVTNGGTWTNGSSQAWKSNFEPLDGTVILEQLARLPISSWEYTGSNEGRHIGPTAEDFRAAFGLGHSEQYIATVDADGVALAAIQALNEKLERENAALKQESEQLNARLERLEQLLLSVDQP